MAILVLGGAGYIGSHMVDLLKNKQKEVIVVDNLVTGHRSAIPESIPFYQIDIRDPEALNRVFKENKIDAVFHFAAFSIVPESMTNPLKYFDNNTIGMTNILKTMQQNNVDKIIFSSTAATYGIPKHCPIKETDLQNPINPYGESKLEMEHQIYWAGKAYDIKWVALRYFNVAGSKADGSIGEDHHPETHLIPIILQAAAGQRPYIEMFGNDYHTADGFNIRDYVHVEDLVEAHLLALKYLEQGGQSTAFNLGSASGFSVKQIVEAAKKATGINFKVKIAPRRLGDPDSLIADSTKAKEILHWHPQYNDITEIIKTAWAFKQKHPNGYTK